MKNVALPCFTLLSPCLHQQGTRPWHRASSELSALCLHVHRTYLWYDRPFVPPVELSSRET